MSHIAVIDPATLGAPLHKKPPPERVIAGDPAMLSWPIDKCKDETVSTGIWECAPGEYRTSKGDACEFCYILSGVIELTDTDGSVRRFKAGDAFMLKPGWTGVWKTIETVRKIYVSVT